MPEAAFPFLVWREAWGKYSVAARSLIGKIGKIEVASLNLDLRL